MKRKPRLFYSIAIAILTVAILGLSYSFYEARNIRLVQYTFSHPEIPSSFDNKKIVFITDFHCNHFFTPEDVSRIVERTNKLNPDIIILGGDYTNKDSIYSTPFFQEIAKLKASHGIYSVLGNHDFWEDAELIRRGLKESGVNICDNQSYWIHQEDDSIKIGGVGDFWEDSQDLDKTIYDVKKQDFCILLSHNPDYIELMNTDRVDLILSGHTHGGQVTLFGLYAPVMPTLWKPHLMDTGQTYRYGWKQHNGIDIYISTGIGVGEFPFRFFAPPEIVEITLKKE